ncbi:PEP-CTERM sorting domain-containing protein [Leptolyngbya iicbica]|uniref:PEP-CTERM sorting domain-containing protein n=2 Tax=Cyanophyceae TaxID=3028117 RepID=A0A4V2E1T3_9CYAN|nr:PEP-CTERM sorting domain-containing protein [Leptolyngbya sp. LK]RZM75199.1 PEP-CTERM sorting domain-containing protein [Leptolyngbya sp. LK]
MLKQSLYALAGAAIIGTSFVGAAEAQVQCSTDNLGGAVDCEGPVEGNPSNDIDSTDFFFGKDDWMQALKVDIGTNTVDGGLTVDGTGTSGTYSLTGLDANHHYMITLKGGNSFSAYLLEQGVTSFTNEIWNTDGIYKGNNVNNPGPDLSNFVVWKNRIDDNGGGEKIPEPAAMAGLMAVGAGIVINRRKKSQ